MRKNLQRSPLCQEPHGFHIFVSAFMTLILFVARLANAQSSEVTFDASGNLKALAGETIAAPLIIGQPQMQIVLPGASASFSVVPADTRGATYQWLFGGSPISGATGDSLVITNVSTNNEGLYSVKVSNGSGTVPSNPANLFVDSDGDGLPDSWEIAHFGNLNQTSAGDSDGDGVSNLQEFFDGTDPTNAASVLYRISLLQDGGTVILSPNQPAYSKGQVVTLTATGDALNPFHAWTGDVTTRSNSISVTMNTNMTLFAHFVPFTLKWTNITGGDWSVATNWTPNLVPASNEMVVIDVGALVTMETNADLINFSLGPSGTAPDLRGTGVLTISGRGIWGSGTMSGSGSTVILPGATLTIGSPVSLVGHTLENMSTIGISGPALNMNGSIITNDAGAVFQALAPLSINYGGGTPRFDNAGSFLNFSGGTTAFQGVAFNNYGAVTILNGNLLLAGGGIQNGTIPVTAGSVLTFGNGTFTGNPSITGAGTLMVTGGNVNLGGTINLSGSNIFSGGALDFTGNYACTNNMVISGCTASFDGTGPITPPILNLTGGSLGGAQNVTVTSAMNWAAGSMVGSGRTIILGGATLTINNPGNFISLTGRTLDNAGTILWPGGFAMSMNNAFITNEPGALFELQGPQLINFGGGTPRFDNGGTLRITGGGCNFAGVSLNNFNFVDIQGGELALNGGGSHSGTMSVPAGTAIGLGGNFSSSAGSSITGAGEFILISGASILNGTVNLSGSNVFLTGSINFTGNYTCTNNTMVISGGTPSFNGTGKVAPATINLISGGFGGSQTVTAANAMTWNGGSMFDSGTTVIPAGATLAINNPGNFVSLNGRTLDNAGTVTWPGGFGMSINGGLITNEPGALFQVQGPQMISFGGGTPHFDNAGTLRITGGGCNFAGMPLNNLNIVDIQGGVLALNGGGTHSGTMTVPAGAGVSIGANFTSSVASSITGAGQLSVIGGGSTLAGTVNLGGDNTFSGGSVNFTGNYNCVSNTMTVSGGVPTFNGSGNVRPATLNLNNGSFGGAQNLTATSAMNWSGGSMFDSGRTIISPGATLTINNPGNFISITGRTLDNFGTAVWVNGFTMSLNAGVITNEPNALFQVLGTQTISYGGGVPRFDNAGTFRKSGSSGSFIFASLPLNNYGTVDIQTGILSFPGAGFTSASNSVLNCAIGGENPGTNYGQLLISGTVNLNGTFSVNLTNNFVPDTNDSFTVVSASVRNGTFSNFIYPSNKVGMVLSNTPTSVVVVATNIISGSQPLLLTPQLSGSNILLTWTSISNHTYRLEFAPGVPTTNWNAIPGDVLATNSTASKTDAINGSTRYYRVRMIP